MKTNVLKSCGVAALLVFAIILIPIIQSLIGHKKYGGPERDIWKIDTALEQKVTTNTTWPPGPPAISRIEIYQTEESTEQSIFYYPLSTLDLRWRVYETEDAKQIADLILTLQRKDVVPDFVRVQAMKKRIPERFHIITYQAHTDKIAYVLYRVGYAEEQPYGEEYLSGVPSVYVNTGFCEWLIQKRLLPPVKRR